MKKILSVFCTAVLLFSVSGCESETPEEAPAPDTFTETKMVTAEYSDHYSNIKMEIPEGWAYEVMPLAESEEIRYTRGGIEFWPEDQPDVRMGLYYYTEPYGICGMGVTREELTFTSGHEAILYWEELGESSYAYVFFKDPPGEYLFEAHYIPTEFWQTERETILSVLDTAVVGEGTLTESEAFAIAEAECVKKYPQSSRRCTFDHLTGQWTFEFHGNPGVVLQTVTVNPDGTVVP